MTESNWQISFLELVTEISIVHGFTGGARFHGVTLTQVSGISDGFTSFWPSLIRSRTKVTAPGKRYTCWPRVCTWLSAKFRKTPPPTRGKARTRTGRCTDTVQFTYPRLVNLVCLSGNLHSIAVLPVVKFRLEQVYRRSRDIKVFFAKRG